MRLSQKKKLASEIVKIASQAAEEIQKIYTQSINVSFKEDSTPITMADTIAHELIASKLHPLSPDIPIISEEGMDRIPENSSTFWLVDPLDGTKEFIQKNDEFTVNIALIEDNAPILGVVYAPALRVYYVGIVGERAFKVIHPTNISRPIHVSMAPVDRITIVGSRSHRGEKLDKFCRGFASAELIAVGSSLKFCKVAEGAAHIYPRLGRTMEWDTAAGHAVLMAAGGDVFSLENEQILSYGKKGFENPYFIATLSKTFFKKTCSWVSA